MRGSWCSADRARSSDVETQIAVSRVRLGHVHAFDARPRRAVPDVMLEAFERFRLAFGLDFDSPVRDVADPAVHSLTTGRGLCEEPEPDSLDAAVNEVPSREAHAEKASDYTPAQSGDRSRKLGRRVGGRAQIG